MDFEKACSVKQFFESMRKEIDAVYRKYPSFHSYHEGYAIILEELDELWDLVKEAKYQRIGEPDAVDLEGMIDETVHIATMALRFYIDLIGDK